jgi:hypothetical protein
MLLLADHLPALSALEYDLQLPLLDHLPQQYADFMVLPECSTRCELKSAHSPSTIEMDLTPSHSSTLATPKRASLLGLPYELREAILHEVFRGSELEYGITTTNHRRSMTIDFKVITASSHRNILLVSKAFWDAGVHMYYPLTKLVLTKGSHRWDKERVIDCIPEACRINVRSLGTSDFEPTTWLQRDPGLKSLFPSLREICLPKTNVWIFCADGRDRFSDVCRDKWNSQQQLRKSLWYEAHWWEWGNLTVLREAVVEVKRIVQRANAEEIEKVRICTRSLLHRP